MRSISRTLLRFLYHLLYYDLAWLYDAVARFVSNGEWNNWVLTVLPEAFGDNILEIGPGTGSLLKRLCEMGKSVYGLDASMSMCNISGKKTGKGRLNSLIVNGYAQCIPVKNSAFDQVLVTFPAEFILLPATLNEIFRVLKDGGELLVLPVAYNSTPSVLSFLFSILIKSAQTSSGNADLPDLTPFSAAGFLTSQHTVIWRNSTVIHIHARKYTSTPC